MARNGKVIVKKNFLNKRAMNICEMKIFFRTTFITLNCFACRVKRNGQKDSVVKIHTTFMTEHGK